MHLFSDTLLVNVYYNPGSEGARFDYGYRGAIFSSSPGGMRAPRIDKDRLKGTLCRTKKRRASH